MKNLNYASINLDVLEKNYAAIKRQTGDSRVICVVKADAYGHGLIQCVRRLRSCGASYFAVANMTEALKVREVTHHSQIIILGYTPPEDAPILAENDLTQAVFSYQYAAALGSAAMATGRQNTVKVHIAIDTGMNRIGFSCDRAGINSIIKTCSLPGLDVRGAYTHFACADDPDSDMTEMQIERFDKAVDEIEQKCGKLAMKHVCNSAGIIRYPDQSRDAVRAGISLYGLDPSEKVSSDGFTSPVMELYTTVTHIHTMKAGECAGYGADFKAERDTKIATLSIGYADGFLRAYAHGSAELLTASGSVEVPIVGRICMDQMLIDITDAPPVKVGDKVRLFGRGAVSADGVASRAGTIGYEVVSGIGKRVPRVYQ